MYNCPCLYSKTILLHIVGRIDIGGARINFQDLGGQTDLQTIWERYYRECHAIVFVVDSSDPERIEECRDALGKLPMSEVSDQSDQFERNAEIKIPFHSHLTASRESNFR